MKFLINSSYDAGYWTLTFYDDETDKIYANIVGMNE